MRRAKSRLRIPTATNTVVVNFEQLASCVRNEIVDVILLDTTFWGGLRQAWKASVICEQFQLGVAVHSSGELGIQLATMRSEEHTSELQSLMRISYAVFCLQKQN